MEREERLQAQPQDLTQLHPALHPMQFLLDMNHILLGCRRKYVLDAHGNVALDEEGNYVMTGPKRREGYNIHGDKPLHPSVQLMIEQGWRARDLHLIALQWPTRADDPARLAYTLNERKMAAGQRTVTTPGKYLMQHFVAPDHVIRDAVARFAATTPYVVHTTEDFVKAVQEGPKSCMHWDWDDDNDYWTDNCGENHPYEVYSPDFGWRMAIRREGDVIMARALWLHHSRGPWQEGEELKGVWVRTYKRHAEPGGYSHADETTEAWFASDTQIKGYDSWPDGAKLAHIDGPDGGFLAPYIDGNVQAVNDCGDHLVIAERGRYVCNNTNGVADRNDDDYADCANCGDETLEDDLTATGYYSDDNRVCQSCLDNNYVSGLGRNNRRYFYPEEDDVLVDGEHYHSEYLSDNEIVELANGEFARMDDAFCCEIRGRWYHVDDGVRAEDLGGAMVHEDEAWLCAASDEHYSVKVEPVTIDGETYHPDWVDENGEVRDALPEPDTKTLPLPFDEPQPERVLYAHGATHTSGNAQFNWARYKEIDGRLHEWRGPGDSCNAVKEDEPGRWHPVAASLASGRFVRLAEPIPERMLYAHGATHTSTTAGFDWCRYKVADGVVNEWRKPNDSDGAKEDEPGRWFPLTSGYDINDRSAFAPLAKPIPEEAPKFELPADVIANAPEGATHVAPHQGGLYYKVIGDRLMSRSASGGIWVTAEDQNGQAELEKRMRDPLAGAGGLVYALPVKVEPPAVAVDIETWHAGPPPSEGWWNASRTNDRNLFRHWDGTRWSRGARPGAPTAFIGTQRSQPAPREDELSWRHVRAPWDQQAALTQPAPVAEPTQPFDDPADVPEGATHVLTSADTLYFKFEDGEAFAKYSVGTRPGDRWDRMGQERHWRSVDNMRALNLPPQAAQPVQSASAAVPEAPPEGATHRSTDGTYTQFFQRTEDGGNRYWERGTWYTGQLTWQEAVAAFGLVEIAPAVPEASPGLCWVDEAGSIDPTAWTELGVAGSTATTTVATAASVLEAMQATAEIMRTQEVQRRVLYINSEMARALTGQLARHGDHVLHEGQLFHVSNFVPPSTAYAAEAPALSWPWPFASHPVADAPVAQPLTEDNPA